MLILLLSSTFILPSLFFAASVSSSSSSPYNKYMRWSRLKTCLVCLSTPTLRKVKDMVLTDIWFRSNNGTLFSRLVLVSMFSVYWFKSGSETCLVSASLLLLFFPQPFDLPLPLLTSGGGSITGWSSCLKYLYLRRRNLI